MPGTDSNSGRCSLLYHSLNSCTWGASISTYTMKIPRPFCAICPSPLWSVAAILLPRLVGTRSSRLEPRRDARHQLRSHLSGHSPDSGAVERDLPSHRGTPQRNSGATSLVRSQSFGLLASRVRNSWLYFIPGTPLPSSSVSSDTAAVMPERAAPVAGR